MSGLYKSFLEILLHFERRFVFYTIGLLIEISMDKS